MNLKKLCHEGTGYLPLIITKEWQVAQLNYCPEQAPDAIKKLDQHTFTDETFTLLKGRALLITYDKDKDSGELTQMELGFTYNVPTMMWHNIAMEQGSSVIITESRDAHIMGFKQMELPGDLRLTILNYTNDIWK